MFCILQYIHDNITTKISVEDVAKRYGYSKWHFCKKFHSYTGCSFNTYVRHYRIQLAAIDILQGKKITDVAMDCGYDSSGGFNKAFLKEYGCYPTEYKKQAKECQLNYERQKKTMYQLSDRCSILREEAVVKKSYTNKYCLQRAVYFS